jgi:hypothetical protein
MIIKMGRVGAKKCKSQGSIGLVVMLPCKEKGGVKIIPLPIVLFFDILCGIFKDR